MFKKEGGSPAAKSRYCQSVGQRIARIRGFEDSASFTFTDIQLTRHFQTKSNTLSAKREKGLKTK